MRRRYKEPSKKQRGVREVRTLDRNCTYVDFGVDRILVSVVEVQAGGQGVDAARSLLFLFLLGLLFLLLLLLVFLLVFLLVGVVLFGFRQLNLLLFGSFSGLLVLKKRRTRVRNLFLKISMFLGNPQRHHNPCL